MDEARPVTTAWTGRIGVEPGPKQRSLCSLRPLESGRLDVPCRRLSDIAVLQEVMGS